MLRCFKLYYNIVSLSSSGKAPSVSAYGTDNELKAFSLMRKITQKSPRVMPLACSVQLPLTLEK